MSAYRIDKQIHTAGTDGWSAALEAAKRNGVRPLCACREPGVPMYIASVSGHLIVKRMPNTGGQHSPSCDSYEPPAELSGLGQVMGSAIQENADLGVTALKLDFSLTKLAGRTAPVPTDKESDSVRADGTKLTLRSALHYLWDQAGFNRWSPAMAGRRTWFTLRKFLLQAAEGKVTKGAKLSDVLFVPETFSSEHRAEIAQRRAGMFSRAAVKAPKGARSLMLVIGEVKEIEPSRYSFKVVFKHLPDAPFMLSADLHRRLTKRFELELGQWDAFDDTHLVAIASFGIGDTGVPSIEEIALMPVTSNWIPFESTQDKDLIDAMTSGKRRFVKGLRYNMPRDRPLASMVASDTGARPTAMYACPPGAGDAYEKALQELVMASDLGSWIWRSGSAMPELPALPPAVR